MQRLGKLMQVASEMGGDASFEVHKCTILLVDWPGKRHIGCPLFRQNVQNVVSHHLLFLAFFFSPNRIRSISPGSGQGHGVDVVLL